MDNIYSSYEVARILTTFFDFSDNNMKDLKDSMDSLIDINYDRLSDKDKKSVTNIDAFLNNYTYQD